MIKKWDDQKMRLSKWDDQQIKPSNQPIKNIKTWDKHIPINYHLWPLKTKSNQKKSDEKSSKISKMIKNHVFKY